MLSEINAYVQNVPSMFPSMSHLQSTYDRYIYTEVDPNRKIPYRHEARENVVRLGRFVKLALLEAAGGVSTVFGIGISSRLNGYFLRLVSFLPPSLAMFPTSSSAMDGIHTTPSSNASPPSGLLLMKAPTISLQSFLPLPSSFLRVSSTEFFLESAERLMMSLHRMSVFTHVVNFYLAPTKPSELDPDYEAKTALYEKKIELQAKLEALATRPTADAPEQFAGYVREALRKSLFLPRNGPCIII